MKYTTRNFTSPEIPVGFVHVHEIKIKMPDFSRKLPVINSIVGSNIRIRLPDAINLNDLTVPVKIEIMDRAEMPKYL